jgi:hypothetical protein
MGPRGAGVRERAPGPPTHPLANRQPAAARRLAAAALAGGWRLLAAQEGARAEGGKREAVEVEEEEEEAGRGRGLKREGEGEGKGEARRREGELCTGSPFLATAGYWPQRQDSQITVPPSERRGGPGTRHFARWKQISR